MKELFTKKFPLLLGMVFIGFACYERGGTMKKEEMVKNIEICSNKGLSEINLKTISKDFYGHEVKEMANMETDKIINHLGAGISVVVSNCYYKEIR